MMGRIAEWLTAFLIDKDIIDKEDAEVYSFGFQAGLEFISCLSVSSGMAVLTHRVMEYLVFLAVFMPVRSYAGGFHFDRFLYCFLGSCALISAVVWLAGMELLTIPWCVKGIAGMLLAIGVIPPAEHENRSVTDTEKAVFHKMLLKILLCIGIGAAGFYIAGNRKYLNLVFLTLLSVLISVLIGKVSQGRKNKRKGDMIYQ